LGEVELSALGEAISQMAGASATEWSTHLGQRILFSPPEVLSGSNGPQVIEADFAAEEALIKVSSRLVIGDLVDGELIWLMAPGVAGQLAQATPPAAIPEPPPLPARGGSTRSHEPAPRPSYSPPQSPKSLQGAPVAVQPANFGDLNRMAPPTDIQNIDLIMDVPLELTVELGRTRKQIKDVLALGPGSLLELDKLAGEAVDVLVNGKLVAKGEVVVIDENFGVRITDILSPAERVKGL